MYGVWGGRRAKRGDGEVYGPLQHMDCCCAYALDYLKLSVITGVYYFRQLDYYFMQSLDASSVKIPIVG
jgi:hypothetical protein